MIRRTLDWLHALMGRPSAARRRKSLCAFGDRLEDRSLLSAVLVSIEPGLADETPWDDAVEMKDIDSAEELQTKADEEIFVTDKTFGGEEVFEAAIDRAGETKPDEQSADVVDEELPVDVIFYTLFSTAGEADEVSDELADGTSTSEPEQRLTVTHDVEPEASRLPAPTLLVSSNPRQAELVTMLYQSIPSAAPPVAGNEFVSSALVVVAARPDALNDSGVVAVAKDVTAKESSKIQPAAAETVQSAPQLVDPDTVKTRRLEVINSLFNQQIPEPEPRELQVPAPTNEAVPELEETTPAIVADDVEGVVPAVPRRFLPTEPGEAVEESTEPVFELKSDDAQAVVPLSKGATTIVAAGAILLSAPHELWRRTRGHFRRHVR